MDEAGEGPGAAAPGLGNGDLSREERNVLLRVFGIDARVCPLSAVAVEFIRTRRRIRENQERLGRERLDRERANSSHSDRETVD